MFRPSPNSSFSNFRHDRAIGASFLAAQKLRFTHHRNLTANWCIYSSIFQSKPYRASKPDMDGADTLKQPAKPKGRLPDMLSDWDMARRTV